MIIIVTLRYNDTVNEREPMKFDANSIAFNGDH